MSMSGHSPRSSERNRSKSNSYWMGSLDQIYSRERYSSRGRFSKKRFDAECLAEYAEVSPTVCGDFALYQFPTPEFWSNLFRRVPSHFQFAFKTPEQITRLEFPAFRAMARWRAGKTSRFSMSNC